METYAEKSTHVRSTDVSVIYTQPHSLQNQLVVCA